MVDQGSAAVSLLQPNGQALGEVLKNTMAKDIRVVGSKLDESLLSSMFPSSSTCLFEFVHTY